LNAGIGWGGSCFPKDTKALRAWADKEGISNEMISGTIKTNESQPLQLIKILKKHMPDLSGKTVGVLGLAFKPDTDDIRDSRSIPLVDTLVNEGANVKAFDPKAMDNFKKLFSDISYCDSAKQVLDADAVLIATAWEEFEKLDYSGKLVIDGRRMLKVKESAKNYEGVCW
jgi:UDPglucose 6-dehydrogenase